MRLKRLKNIKSNIIIRDPLASVIKFGVQGYSCDTKVTNDADLGIKSYVVMDKRMSKLEKTVRGRPMKKQGNWGG